MSIPVSRPRSALATALGAAALCAVAAFAVPPALAAPADSTNTPPLPVSFETFPLAPCTADSVALVAISPCSPCVDLVSFGRESDGHLRLEFTQMGAAACGTLPCQLEEAVVPLGRLAAGHFTVDVEVVWHFPPDTLGAGGGTRTLHRLVSFDVGRCPAPLPYIQQVVVAGIPPCATCPPEACPDRPVIVGLQGALPNACWSLLGFEMLPLASPIDRPVARLTVRPACPESLVDCPTTPVPFSVGTSFPAPAPGLHELEIQVAERACDDSTELQIHSQLFTYVVKDTCAEPPPPAACVWPYLEARMLRADTLPANAPRCDLRLLPGGRGPVLLATRSQGTPLAGLQGDLGVSSFLKIVNVEAAGAAAGMRLQWAPKENGASFVLFSGGPAPIPADRWAPVLRVTVAADSGLATPLVGGLHGVVRAASDSNGTSVPVCPIMTLVLPTARVCVVRPASCDANGDGVSNVADLVRMVRCIVQPGWCPDSAASRPDCNDDGEFHLDDVFCCARAILGVPRDSAGHGPGNLRFAFGPPELQGSLLRVPLRVQGAEDLAGALLRLDYPSDRWIAVDDAVAGGDPLRTSSAADWTPLVEPGEDDVLVGLLRFDPAAPGELAVTLAFALRPGATPGGELRVGASELSAADGTPIELDLSGLATRLEPATSVPIARVGLSPARPNPASGATSFVVNLPAAGEVDLAMYDLAGRRVATLWRGALPAGEREFTWRPADAPSGVYFARLVVNGEVRSSRVTFKLGR